MKLAIFLPLFALVLAANAQEPKQLRAGIIGLDTSHVLAFTQTLNKGPKKPEDADKTAGVKVIAAYPQGSKDIESSTKRVPEYTEKVKALGVEIVDSIDELLKRVDVVFLESNDGRVHLEQIQPVLKAGKPVFIDKPIAGSLADTVRIFDAAKKAKVRWSVRRHSALARRPKPWQNGSIGEMKSAETFTPARIEFTPPELFWYGGNGSKTLFSVLGPGLPIL